MNKEIEELVSISNLIGEKAEFVQGGGGNTSLKINENKMAIKASGYLLKDMNENTGYVCLNYKKILEAIELIEIKSEDEEEKLNELIMDNRIEVKELPLLRPSIEAGFHALLEKYVMHSHSVYSNIINCSLEGKKILQDILLDKEYIFVNYTSPGLGLTLSVRDKIKEHKNKFGSLPSYVFLENHGLIVSSSCYDDVVEKNKIINEKIKNHFSIHQEYPTIMVDNCLESENISIFEIIERIKDNLNFEWVLFPDQVVYFKENISFEKDKQKKINIDLDNKKINYNVKTRVEAISIEETLLSYVYILDQIMKHTLTPKFINKEEQNYISNMKTEQYRKKVMEKGGE